jgi:hypothetical protein
VHVSIAKTGDNPDKWQFISWILWVGTGFAKLDVGDIHRTDLFDILETNL